MGSENDEWEDVRIDQIEAGDEILTLDETTGEFIPSRVEGLMEMGTKGIVKITTVSGKSIRTTAEHPYLVKNTQQEKKDSDTNTLYHQTFEQTQEAAFAFYKEVLEGESIRVPLLKEKVYFSRAGWSHLVEEKKSRFEVMARFFALAKIPFVLKLADTLVKPPLTIQHEDNMITYWALQGIVEGAWIRVIIRSINNGPKYFHSVIWKGEEHRREVQNAIKKGAVSRLYPRRQASVSLAFSTSLWKKYNRFMKALSTGKGLPVEDVKSSKWVKVKDLKVDQRIATIDGWERVEKIEHLPAERVWDIEVAGTHNFVGNNIVAHNTYLNGNVGIGTSSPAGLLDVDGSTGIRLNTTQGSATAIQLIARAGGIDISTG
ncbi:hypothetical protein HYZ70_02970, partial [Candidatus Curtissbacteria bacterium]|nr:hypothetical protein [Candidatus Curtissbacteria bacterium]